MNKIIFCQFSNKLLNKDSQSISDKYYNQIWIEKEKDGYWKSQDFWEIPLWITEISGSLTSDYKTELYIIKDIEKAIEKINKEKAYICFSVLDINKHEVSKIITRYEGKGKIILGGYIDFSYFDNLMECIKENIIICKSVKQFIEYLKIPYEYNLDYSLFKGYKTIPRLTLSYGCLNRCKFCTVENKHFTPKYYDKIANSYKRIAKKFGLLPNQFQAIIWLTFKRIHNIKVNWREYQTNLPF